MKKKLTLCSRHAAHRHPRDVGIPSAPISAEGAAVQPLPPPSSRGWRACNSGPSSLLPSAACSHVQPPLALGRSDQFRQMRRRAACDRGYPVQPPVSMLPAAAGARAALPAMSAPGRPVPPDAPRWRGLPLSSSSSRILSQHGGEGARGGDFPSTDAAHRWGRRRGGGAGLGTVR
jgi:hypothetical protein